MFYLVGVGFIFFGIACTVPLLGIVVRKRSADFALVSILGFRLNSRSLLFRLISVFWLCCGFRNEVLYVLEKHENRSSKREDIGRFDTSLRSLWSQRFLKLSPLGSLRSLRFVKPPPLRTSRTMSSDHPYATETELLKLNGGVSTQSRFLDGGCGQNHSPFP